MATKRKSGVLLKTWQEADETLRRKKAIAAALAAVAVAAYLAGPAIFALSLVGCSSPPDHGVVVDRAFTPSHDRIIMRPVFCGKFTVFIPTVIHSKNRWTLTIRDDEGRDHAFGVDRAEYETLSVGDTYRRAQKNEIPCAMPAAGGDAR